PVPGAPPIAAPAMSFHLAGPPLPSSHLARLVPSTTTVASAGGGTGSAGAPGITTAATGRSRECCGQSPIPCCENAADEHATLAINTARILMFVFIARSYGALGDRN